MSSGEIHQAVARVTGESIRVIRQFGFSLLVPGVSHDDEPDGRSTNRFELMAGPSGGRP